MHPLNFNYQLGSIIVAQNTETTDLGVVFDTKLRFHLHVEGKVKSAFKMLGFVMRTCRDISNMNCVILLYNVFVRSILEYACVVWNPIYKCHIDLLESVQRRFLKYLYFRTHRIYPPRGYPQVELINEFNFMTLEARRSYFDMKFLIKFINNAIFIDKIYFKITYVSNRVNSRHKQLFFTPYVKTNVLINSPLVRLCRLANSCYPILDASKIKLSEYNITIMRQLLESTGAHLDNEPISYL